MRAPDLAALLTPWKLALAADRKLRQTVSSYITGVTLFLRWCAEKGHAPALERSLVRTWVTELLDGGAAAATARSRQMALKRYSAWLTEEGEADTDALAGLKPPKLDIKVVEGLTDQQCAALVKACQGKEFIDRRDEAVARLLLETGLRARELLGLAVEDVDVVRGLAVVRRGKGGKGRVVPFGPEVARSIDRYLRMRKGHRLARSECVGWLRDGDQLVVVAVDRLGRSVREVATALHELTTRGVHVRSLREGVDTSTATGRAVTSIMATIAELELELGKERRAASREARLARGLAATKPMKLDAAQQKRLLRLYQQGEPVTELTSMFGISRSTLFRTLKVLKGQEPLSA